MHTTLLILFLVLGFIILVKGADFLVQGSSSLAQKLSISEIIIGLTIVSFGTSAPELVVNVFASLRHNGTVVLGNIIGSNIINIVLILGISGLIFPLAVQKNTVWREIPFSLLSVILLALMANDTILTRSSSNILSRIDGLLLLGCFLFFIIYIFLIARPVQAEPYTVQHYSYKKIVFSILTGLLALFFGGKLVVDNAILLAQQLQVQEKFISLTIVALGTSLPELATSAVAAYRKNADIAVGNIVGSNIFNIFFILGISSLINPVSYSLSFNSDLFVLFTSSLLLFIFMFTGKKKILDRWEAILFLIIYLTHLVYISVSKNS